MIVKAIKTEIALKTKGDNPHIVRFSLRDVDIGKEYVVYELHYDLHYISWFIRIYDFECEQLVIQPLELFEVIDDNISSFWKYYYENDASIYFTPELFKPQYFFDSFSDFDELLREKFYLLKELMDKEAYGQYKLSQTDYTEEIHSAIKNIRKFIELQKDELKQYELTSKIDDYVIERELFTHIIVLTFHFREDFLFEIPIYYFLRGKLQYGKDELISYLEKEIEKVKKLALQKKIELN